MRPLPPVANVQPGSWGQPLQSRTRERYVYSEKELRRAISDAISSPAVTWEQGDSDIVAQTSTYMTIVIASGITVTSQIDIPATANGLKITQTGGGFLQPASNMAGGICFNVSATTLPDGRNAFGFLVWFDGLTVKWAAGDSASAFATSIQLNSNVYSTRITNCYLYGNIVAASANKIYMANTELLDGAACTFGANTYISNCRIGHPITLSGKAIVTGCDLESVTVSSSVTDVIVTGCRLRDWTDTASNGGNLVTGCLISGTVSAHASSSVDDPGGTRVTNNNF